ncbi:MAG: RluA family pseudouridine synthase, partial [Treponemataceae bacterium]|nr:RluA family pseudouridine synthase [Treponemataceae bacterium]
HQIRAHLSQCRMPILGDTLYGGESAQRIFLHAQKLELPHPCTGEILKLVSPVPKEFENYFYQLR